jgi:hypothetical protein
VAVARRQLLQPQLADAQRAALRAEVAEHLLGRARVRRDDRDDALVLRYSCQTLVGGMRSPSWK